MSYGAESAGRVPKVKCVTPLGLMSYLRREKTKRGNGKIQIPAGKSGYSAHDDKKVAVGLKAGAGYMTGT